MLDTAITLATEQCPHNILAFISQLLLHKRTERLQDKKQFVGIVGDVVAVLKQVVYIQPPLSLK
jgi:hypothetical protein